MTEFDLHTKVDLENGSPAFAKPVLAAGRLFTTMIIKSYKQKKRSKANISNLNK